MTQQTFDSIEMHFCLRNAFSAQWNHFSSLDGVPSLRKKRCGIRNLFLDSFDAVIDSPMNGFLSRLRRSNTDYMRTLCAAAIGLRLFLLRSAIFIVHYCSLNCLTQFAGTIRTSPVSLSSRFAASSLPSWNVQSKQ